MVETSFQVTPSMAPSHHRTNNVVHNDDEARKLGFKAGLITGTTTYAYLTRPAVAHFGAAWFEGMQNSLKLKAPTFEGEHLTAKLNAASPSSCDISLAGSETDIRAVLACSKLGSPPAPLAIPAAPLNTARPRLTPAHLTAGTVLGTLKDALDESECLEYLEQLDEPNDIYKRSRIVHPGQLLHLANEVMMNNFTLGPWFHAKTELINRKPINMGKPIEVRAKVLEASERNGSKLATIDYNWVLPDGTVAMSARHSIVYERAST